MLVYKLAFVIFGLCTPSCSALEEFLGKKTNVGNVDCGKLSQ